MNERGISIGSIIMTSLFCLLATAAWMDLRTRKISNRLILSGWMLGCIRNLLEYGWKGSIYFLIQISLPVLMFYLLFLMRALGAGDIKLFSVISSCIGIKGLLKVVFFSFLAGAGLSLAVMIRNRNFYQRITYFFSYSKTVLLTKSIKKYDYESDGKQNYIHFSIAVWIGFAMYLGGM